MGKTITKSATKQDMKRAEELMRQYNQSFDNKKALMERIKNELDAYNKNMKEAEAELIEIGNRNLDQFNEDGNLVFDDGYLHIVNSAVVLTSKKFDLAAFYAAHPEFVDVDLKKGEIKKAFTDKALRKELKGFGVDIDNEQSLKVIPAKKI